MEAVNALNKLSTRVSNTLLSNILSNVLLKLRPCFEKVSLRQTCSITLSVIGAVVEAANENFNKLEFMIVHWNNFLIVECK